MNRLDGRQADQLRPVTITPHFFAYAEGSTLIQIGDTRVACAVSVEDKVPPFLVGKGQGWLTAEYAMLPRATLTRSNRETKGVSGRSQEIQRLIGRSLRQVVDLKKLGERTLSVDCDVLQADGGTRTAAITGACAAVEIALQRLVSDGTLKSMPIRSRIAAVSVGIVKNSSLLDLAYLEDSKADADCNIVMTDQGDIVEIQATAEQEPFSYNRLLELIDLARKGINELLIVQKSAVAVPLLTADAAHG